MVRLSLLLCSLLAVASPAAAQVRRAVMEGLPATSNTIFIDTNTVRVGVGTASPSYAVDAVGDIRASGYFRGNGSLLTGVITSTAALQAQINAVAVSTGALSVSTASLGGRVGFLEVAASTAVYTTQTYNNPSWISSLATSKIDLSTVTSHIDTKVSKAGDTMTDNLIVGASVQANIVDAGQVWSSSMTGRGSAVSVPPLYLQSFHDYDAQALKMYFPQTGASVIFRAHSGSSSALEATGSFSFISSNGTSIYVGATPKLQQSSSELTLNGDVVSTGTVTANKLVGGESYFSGVVHAPNLTLENFAYPTIEMRPSVNFPSIVMYNADGDHNIGVSSLEGGGGASDMRLRVYSGGTRMSGSRGNFLVDATGYVQINAANYTDNATHALDVVGGAVFTSSVTASAFYGSGANLTDLPAGGVTVSTFSADMAALGDIYLSSGSFNLYGMPQWTITAGTITITGIRCYTGNPSSVGPSSFNIARSTDTGATNGWSYLYSSSITVNQNSQYSPWVVPDVASNGTINILPAKLALHVNGIPSSGTLPSNYGCTVKFWRRLDAQP